MEPSEPVAARRHVEIDLMFVATLFFFFFFPSFFFPLGVLSLLGLVVQGKLVSVTQCAFILGGDQFEIKGPSSHRFPFATNNLFLSPACELCRNQSNHFFFFIGPLSRHRGHRQPLQGWQLHPPSPVFVLHTDTVSLCSHRRQ